MNRYSTRSIHHNYKLTGVIALSTAILAFAIFTVPKLSAKIDHVALICAGFAMPEGGISLFEDNLLEKNNSTAVLQNNEGSNQNKETEIQTISRSNLTKTPTDVLALMEDAKTAFANLSNDGTIISQKYDASSATHTYGKVTVKNTTKQSLDIAKTLKKEVDLKITDKSKPAILIFHTHTTESYELLDRGWFSNSYPVRSENSALNMVRVGAEIAAQLEEAGFEVIHDKTIFDTKYSGAYDRSEVAIKKHMKDNPNIQVVLDVHRDAIHLNNGKKIKPTAEINGKKAAQIMIISGCQEGKITGFPDWEYNLRFALNLQKYCEEMYPGLMRPVFFCPRKYNMHTTRCSLLLEMGSDANTLEEAVYSGALIGNALTKLLENYVVED